MFHGSTRRRGAFPPRIFFMPATERRRKLTALSLADPAWRLCTRGAAPFFLRCGCFEKPGAQSGNMFRKYVFSLWETQLPAAVGPPPLFSRKKSLPVRGVCSPIVPGCWAGLQPTGWNSGICLFCVLRYHIFWLRCETRQSTKGSKCDIRRGCPREDSRHISLICLHGKGQRVALGHIAKLFTLADVLVLLHGDSFHLP